MVEALCTDDLDMFGTELDDPLEELAQDLYHRLLEPPGSNIDDPARGFGLESQLSIGARVGSPTMIVQQGIEGELRKDERVSEVRAVVIESAPGEYDIAIQIVCDEGLLGITLVADGSGVRRVA